MTLERYATVEWQQGDGPRHIDRFPWRKDGDYLPCVPEGATIINVWQKGEASPAHKGSEQDD